MNETELITMGLNDLRNQYVLLGALMGMMVGVMITAMFVMIRSENDK
mgnify:CR=1 FL=1